MLVEFIVVALLQEAALSQEAAQLLEAE